jgi:LynF/TruF/PatF family peptide O-prenyltransferase
MQEASIKRFFHHKNLFGIKNDRTLDLFELLLQDSKNADLECSIKFQDGKIFPARFNIWYTEQKEMLSNLKKTLNFFNNMSQNGFRVNFSLMKKIFENSVDFNRIGGIVIGTDVRDNKEDSRLKFWAVTKEYPEFTERVLKLRTCENKDFEIFNPDSFLVGVDFYPDGRTSLKMYTWIKTRQIHDQAFQNTLSKHFSDAAAELIKSCKTVHISSNGQEMILHCRPENPKAFIEEMHSPEMKQLADKLDIYKERCVIISLSEEEIKQKKITKFNMYYT